MADLGKLVSVPLCDVWKREARDFTPWLAKAENLQSLGDAIGMELEFIQNEKEIGPFRADIFCRNINDDSAAVIENQIKPADHRHLGQLLTYAAGLEAVTIIWVAESFSDEHRATLDWLNKNTNADIHFFGLKIEAWKIGNSEVAPKFNIISQPNDWRKGVSRKVREEDNDYKNLRLKYWTQLSSYLDSDKDSPIKLPTPSRENISGFYIFNNGGAFLRLSISKTKTTVALHLKQDMEKDYYNKFHAEKDNIEKALGESLEWKAYTEKGGDAIIRLKKETNIENEENWNKLHEWSKEQLEKFTEIFRQKLKNN